MSRVADAPMQGSRDLRIDFIRGVVMFLLVVVHIEFFSAYSLVAWERVGLVSGAEGFVILSGFVVGMVFGARIQQRGFGAAAGGLVDRALQLYRVNLFVIVSIALLRAWSLADTTAVTTFTDQAAHLTYSLYWVPDAPLANKIADVVLLRSGPHQMQILGLYVALLVFSPIALWLLSIRRTGVLLLISAVLYIRNWAFPGPVTTAQFENAFPLLTWQFIYVLGMTAGFHRARVKAFMQTGRGRAVFAGAVLVAAAMFVWAQMTPNPLLPSWARLSLVPPDLFWHIRDRWFDKNTLGVGRIVNYFALLIIGYAVLTRYWTPIARALGWFFVPIGQASLYVFIVHVFIVLLVSNIAPFGLDGPQPVLLHTLLHTLALVTLWLMVRYQVLFGWIPR